MRILDTTEIRGIAVHEANLNPSIWLVAPPTFRGNPRLSTGTSDSSRRQDAPSRQTLPKPEILDLPEDDFPFSALIRLVRQMRQ